MKRLNIIYGWENANGVRNYVWQHGTSWCVTKNPKKATAFSSVQACIAHWLSKHSFPEKYLYLLDEGYLHFTDKTTGQMILGVG